MYKYTLLILILLLQFPIMSFAQLEKSKKPRPDWAFVKPSPKPENKRNLAYYIGVGYGETLPDATNKAKADALKQALLRIGVQISSADLYKAEQDAEYIRLLTEQFEIPINFLCDYFEPIGNIYKVQYLCQAAINANIAPRFDSEEFVETFERIGQINAAKNEKEKNSNARAIAASTFIPGLGQMLKKQGGSGAAFLLSELALFGGGTACYFLGQDQAKIMKTSKSYEQYTNAKNMKNTLDIAMFTCFGVGAVVHIGNMVHAWYVKDKKLTQNFSFAPTIIPTNEYSQPSYAYGAGVQIKF